MKLLPDIAIQRGKKRIGGRRPNDRWRSTQGRETQAPISYVARRPTILAQFAAFGKEERDSLCCLASAADGQHVPRVAIPGTVELMPTAPNRSPTHQRGTPRQNAPRC